MKMKITDAKVPNPIKECPLRYEIASAPCGGSRRDLGFGFWPLDFFALRTL
jgi:hypothetical protein